VATRGRLTGVIPIEAIDDDTREETEWQTWDNPDSFIKEQFEGLLTGYVRNKLQSQPNHFQMVVEKNTIKNYLKEVAADFGIHVVVGRGQPSIPPRRNVANRFWRSGKEKLVLILVGDFDPDGEAIVNLWARSLRDDFGISESDIHAVKVALTQNDVRGLPPSNLEVKETSKNYSAWLDKYGADQAAYELEAVRPDMLQQLVRKKIESLIDRRRYQEERRIEREVDAPKIMALRKVFGDQMLKKKKLD